jgi:hypothetical protein
MSVDNFFTSYSQITLSCFYVMTMRYRCKSGDCATTVNGYDSTIMRQLPLRLQAEFPVYLTHRSAVSKQVARILRTCVQNSTGPKRFSDMLQEWHMLKHDELELQYLDAVVDEMESPTMLSSLHNMRPVPFSAFRDRSKYAGHIPSAKLLRSVYTSMIKIFRPYMDQQMAMLDGKILKGDHSFKVIKHIAQLGKQPIFNAMYTVCNEFGEIRVQVLTPTKSLSHLKASFEDMRRSYELYGHSLPDVFFTDNVRGDKKFLQSVLPSLQTGSIELDNTYVSQLPAMTIPSGVGIHVIRGPENINRAANILMEAVSDGQTITTGVTCNWIVNVSINL